MNRQEARQELALTMGDTGVGLVTEVTTSAGNAGGTTVICTGLTQQNDYWNGGQVIPYSGTYAGYSRRITDWVLSTNTLTTVAFGGTIANGVNIEVLLSHVYAEYNGAFDRAIRYARNKTRFLQSYVNESLTLDASTYEYVIPRGKVVSGTAGATSTTTTLVNTGLTQADNYWIGAKLTITGGTNAGKYRYITDSDQSDTSVTFDAFDTAIDATSTFYLERFEPVYLYRVEYEDTDGDWLQVEPQHWAVIRRGSSPVIRFTHNAVGAYADQRIRLLGQRLPALFVNEMDECEVDEEYLMVYAEQILRGAVARRRDLDVEDNRARRLELRQEAELILQNDPTVPFPGARRCQ
jgi:hypothetical protein